MVQYSLEFRRLTIADKPKTAHRLRDSSFVVGTTIVFTVVSMMAFTRFGVPLTSAEEIAVVAGFWFVLFAGCVWIWKYVRRRRSRTHVTH